MLQNLETFRTMFHEISVIIFLLLKAIVEIEESAEENAKKHNKQRKKTQAEQQQIPTNEA